jgi:hypothetical protein
MTLTPKPQRGVIYVRQFIQICTKPGEEPTRQVMEFKEVHAREASASGELIPGHGLDIRLAHALVTKWTRLGQLPAPANPTAPMWAYELIEPEDTMIEISSLLAQPVDGANPKLPLIIRFEREVKTEGATLGALNAEYQAQAKKLVDAMTRHIPGGLFDALTVEFLDRKRSLFAVAHVAEEPAPAPVASTETHILNLDLLTRVARSPGVQVELINLQHAPQWDFAPIVLEMLAAAGDGFTPNWETYLQEQAGSSGGDRHTPVAKTAVRSTISLTIAVREALGAACAAGASFDQLIDAVRIVFTAAIVTSVLAVKRSDT